MIVESHDRLGCPEAKKATRIVVYDDFKNAIAVFMQIGNDNIEAFIRGQRGFEEALKFLGVRQTTICDVVTAKDLPRVDLD